MTGERLGTYRAKRDFARTPEPAGSSATPDPGAAPGFVVQQHAARQLHYDVRLEVDGVLASWAVPKGPSYDPSVKRLAIHVEDHPLDYRDFEGRIPGGEYGSGRVIVWDEGSYANLTERDGTSVPVAEAIANGHLSVWLEGSKLHGGWSLTKTSRPGARQESWVMVKRHDEYADPERDLTADSRSVLSGRELGELGEDERSWTRGRATFVPPMLAELAREAPGGSGWVLERKFDGLRAIAVRNADEVELWSRNHQRFTERFPTIVAAIRQLPSDNVTLDGEVVAYDGSSTSFELLQRPGSRAAPVLEVFDVVHLLGQDTTGLALEDRRGLVTQLLGTGRDGVLRAVEALPGTADQALARACQEGWEGVIAKRAGSTYRSGRSSDWRKLKCDARQELVIGGWTEPRGSREHLGALLVGYYDADQQLRFAGKVGTGFDRATLAELAAQLAPRAVAESPFADLPRLMARDAHFVRPELVANVAFAEWTADGRLRQPRYQGLRPDKEPHDVVREAPSAEPALAPPARRASPRRAGP